MPATYGKSTFQALLGIDNQRFSSWVEVRDDGVWVNESLERDFPNRYAWTFSMDLDQLDGPDPKKGLALAFDFTAAELAAFMLDGGAGHALRSAFGGFNEGPLESSLGMIGGADGYRAVHALKEAYRCIHNATNLAGQFDGEVFDREERRLLRQIQEQDAAEEQLRCQEMPNRKRMPLLLKIRTRSRELGVELASVRHQRDERYFIWRKKMVSALLRPERLLGDESAESDTRRLFHVLDDIERIKERRQIIASASTSSIDEIDRQAKMLIQLRNELAAAEKRRSWLESSAAPKELETANHRHSIKQMARVRRGGVFHPANADSYWDSVAETNRLIDGEIAIGATLACELAEEISAQHAHGDIHARRYQMCIDEGLVISPNTYANLPRGVGKLAKREGISQPAFSKSVRIHQDKVAKLRG